MMVEPKKDTVLELLRTRKFNASFRAKYLHALEPIIRSSQDDGRLMLRCGLFVEPCDEGGVLLIAADGVSLGVIRDKDGRASQRMRIYIPDDIFSACTPRKPVDAWAEGERLAVALPEWAQPGEVVLYELAAYVTPAMHHPAEEPEYSYLLGSSSIEEGNSYDGGYRLHEENASVPWRAVLARTGDDGCATLGVDPGRLGMFERLFNLFVKESDEHGRRASLIMTMNGRENPIRIQLFDEPNFIGAFMPMGNLLIPPVPAWAKEGQPG